MAKGKCCVMGGCTTCPPPPPPPPMGCMQDAQCPPGRCCMAGACNACPVDAGVIPDGALPPPNPDLAMIPGCNSCLDCQGQACINAKCDSCSNSAQCCAPLVCDTGKCIMGVGRASQPPKVHDLPKP